MTSLYLIQKKDIPPLLGGENQHLNPDLKVDIVEFKFRNIEANEI